MRQFMLTKDTHLYKKLLKIVSRRCVNNIIKSSQINIKHSHEINTRGRTDILAETITQRARLATFDSSGKFRVA